MDKFELVSKFTPTGDQPEAINKLVNCVIGLKLKLITQETR